jgi:hypothetical protein
MERMQIHKILDNAEAELVGVGGEVLAGSGVENEDPATDFAADVVSAIAANQRED